MADSHFSIYIDECGFDATDKKKSTDSFLFMLAAQAQTLTPPGGVVKLSQCKRKEFLDREIIL